MRDRRRKEHPGSEKRQPTVILSGLAMDVKLARGQAAPIETREINPVLCLLESDEREIYRLSCLETIPQRDIGTSLGLSRYQVCRILRDVSLKLSFFGALRKKLSEEPSSFRRFFAGSRCQWCEEALLSKIQSLSDEIEKLRKKSDAHV